MAPDSKANDRVSNVAGHLKPPAEPPAERTSPRETEAVHAIVSQAPPVSIPWGSNLNELTSRRAIARTLSEDDPGILRQRDQGKFTCRERIAMLLDPRSFREIGTVAGSATYDKDNDKLVSFVRANFIAGKGTIEKRPCIVGADDFSVRGGHADGAIGRKAIYIEGLARELRIPLIRLVDGSSGGGSVAVVGKAGYSKITSMPGFHQSVKMLDEIPVAAACLGPAVGLGAAKAATAHFTVMPKNGSLFAAGPPVVIPATHENLSKTQLGGPNIHGLNGTVDLIVENEEEAIAAIRRWLSYLPTNRWTMPPMAPAREPASDPSDPYKLLKLIPESNTKPYDPLDYLVLLADEGSIMELGLLWGREVRTFFARFAGFPVVVFTGDPRYSGGALGAKACDKLCRMIGIAGTFHLPIVNFVDCPGFAVGSAAEKTGTIRAGAKLTAVSYDSRVPWYCVVVRKAYGVGGGILVARGEGDEAGTNVRVAWPMGEWGSLPLAGGVEAAFKGVLNAIKDPLEREKEKVRIAKHLHTISNPIRSAEAFDVEEIVSPLDTRELIIDWVKLVYETRIPALIMEDSARTRGKGASIYIP